jgi:exonuclease SbcD
MKIIHTSDWHFGAQLYEQSRHPEQEKFTAWLKELMRKEKPDALIVAGDIFDTYSPPNASLELYYSLLGEIIKESLCRTVVVVGGNHDSPTMLDSPDKVLSQLSIKVIGGADIEKEILFIKDKDGKTGLAVGAVPYLRDADLRLSGEGEDFSDVSSKLRAGLKKHYQEVAKNARAQAGKDVPLLLTGHLFLSKSKLSDELSERTRQIGNIGEIPYELLPPADYFALGHLHIPQAVAGNELCRYSGAPIPMSFSEAGQGKSVAIVEFAGKTSVSLESVPCFQRLEQIRGTTAVIEARIKELLESSSNAWLDVQVNEHEGDLSEFWNNLSALVEKGSVKILTKQDARPHRPWNKRGEQESALETIKPEDVFKMRLDEESLSADEKAEFTQMFEEIIRTRTQDDIIKEQSL